MIINNDKMMTEVDDKKNDANHEIHANGFAKKVNCNLKTNDCGDKKVSHHFTGNSNNFSFYLEINAIAVALFVISLALRVYKLGYPPNIVFDELHYVKFVGLYLNGIFYFDSQPPLGKQLIAIVGYFAGYNGKNSFSEIGSKYDNDVPLKALRFVPALFGSLISPIVYHLVVELNFKQRTATFAAILVILENSILTQSRFVLMDSIMIFMSLFGLFAIIKMRKRKRLTASWFSWLTIASTFLTFGFCVKFVGLFAFVVAFFIVAYDFWQILPDKTIKTASLWLESFIYFIAFIVYPLIIYMTIFYIHLSVLTKAGPHDNVMTSAFQASLEGGLASITKGQPLEIVHGSQITLRHTHGRTCWLHSHSAVYPVKYADGRGSSHQQQVTCYSFKDVNNWWIVKRPDNADLIVAEPRDRIKHGDIVQLVHGISTRTLNSHDVAAPVSPQHQEVSCYIDYNISMAAENLWRIDLINKEDTDGYWHTIRSKVRLVHESSGQVLKFSGKQLPDWGFNQHEIVTDKIVNQDDAVWNVEEHRYTKLSDQKERERDMVGAEFVPLAPTDFTFWEKMKELQYKMLTYDQENIPDHVYACDGPFDWLFLSKGIAYWIDLESNAQIHLIGNVFIWYLSLAALVVYVGLFAFYLMRRRRKFYDLEQNSWEKFTTIGLFGLTSYLVHFVPYFFIERTLFLHHYLPVVVFKILILATLIEHLETFIRHNLILIFIQLLILSAAFYTFNRFLLFSYGTGSPSADDIVHLKWLKTWNFIVHK